MRINLHGLLLDDNLRPVTNKNIMSILPFNKISKGIKYEKKHGNS